MTKKFQTLAEMDGFKVEQRECIYDGLQIKYDYITRDGRQFNQVPNYDSYDGIMPLIQKQPYKIKAAVYDFFTAEDAGWTTCAVSMLDASPSKLCEALLHVTGKSTDAQTPHEHSYREDSTVCEICGE